MRTHAFRTFTAVFTLAGTIIGIGIVGVPYVVARVGWAAALVLFSVVGMIQLLQHLMYAEAAIATRERLRLPGLVRKYLGTGAGTAAFVIQTLGFWGSQLAYIIGGGAFLFVLLGPVLGGTELVYQLAWAVIGAVIVLFGLRTVTKVDVAATVVMFAAVAVLFAIGAPYWSASVVPASLGRIGDLALAYGVILYATSGLPAILELEEIVGGDRRRYRRSILLGTTIATTFTAAFGFFAVGILGNAVTETVAGSLGAALGPFAGVTLAVFGFLAVITSYFPLALNLRTSFEVDLRMPPLIAWVLAVMVPIIFFLVSGAGFIRVLGFIGAVLGGFTVFLVAAMYLRVTRMRLVKTDRFTVSPMVVYAMMAVVFVGAGYEIMVTIRKLLG